MKNVTIVFITSFLMIGILGANFFPSIKSEGYFNDPEPSPPIVKMVKSDRNGVILNIRLNGICIEEKEVNGEIFHIITLLGYGHLDEIGKPRLPAIRFFLAVPPEVSETQINISNSTCTILHGFNVYPVQNPVPEPSDDEPFTINTTFYQGNEFYPEDVATIESSGWIRDYRFIFLEICPILFNPGTNELKIYNTTEIRVTFIGSKDGVTGVTRPGFETTYESIFINYEVAKNWYPQSDTLPTEKQRNTSDLLNTTNRAGLLIITNDTFYHCIQPLANWKDRKGMETFIANLSDVYSQFPAGTNTESIRSFINYTYHNWSRAPSHVLLIGDVEYLPTFYYQGYTATDHWYSLLVGNDPLSDVFIGRISVKNCSETSEIVDKIITYERTPYLNETAWYKKAMLVSDTGYFEVTSNWVYDFLTNHSYSVDKLYESLGTATTSNIADAINDGRAIANYRGHGSTTGWATGPFSNSNVLALTNGRKLPIVISPTCSTGHYDDPDTDCYGETWLKAPDKGGVSFWGSSRVSYGGYNDELDMGVYKAIFNDSIYDFGGFTNKAKLYMIAVYGTSSTALLELHLFNVIGDSTLEFWTNVPHPLNVTHPTVVSPQPSSFTVTVTNGSTPVENACVFIEKNPEIRIFGYTNTSGEVQFSLPMLSPGKINITVTKHDFIPYEGNVSVCNTVSLSEGWNFVSLPFNQTIPKQNLSIWFNQSFYTWQDAVNMGLISDFVFGWNRTSQSFMFTDFLKPGEGYWMYAYNTFELWMQSSATPDDYITSLETKWNIVGAPISQPINKTELLLSYNGSNYNWSEAVAAGIVNDYIFGWDHSGQSYTFSDVFEPGYCYWMYAFETCTLKRCCIVI